MVKLSYINVLAQPFVEAISSTDRLQRKSEGVKLGQIIAKDLRKRTKPLSASSRAEPQENVSLLELNLEGKVLSDEGVREAAQGLEDTLNATNSAVITKLQVLNLSRNGLTVRALSTLAPCIRAAAQDLEDLDLSNNDIRITSDEDAEHWETFLQSFAPCQALKRLNLAGNDLSGPKAFEIFCKVYLRQFRRIETHLDIYVDNDTESALSLPIVAEDFRNLTINTQDDAARNDSAERSSNGAICGLPRTHNIVIANTSMTDVGALFLSYTLAQHIWTMQRLSSRLRLTTSAASLPGMTYLPNDGIGAVGLKMLKLTETISYDPFESSDSPFGPENSPNTSFDNTTGSQSRKISNAHQRKLSTGISMTDQLTAWSSPFHSQQFAVEELESLRRKTQRAFLEDVGPQNVQLWRAALRLLAYTRRLLIGSRSTSAVTVLDQFDFPQAGDSAHGQAMFASRLLIDSNITQGPACAIVGVSNEPVTPQIYRQPRRRRDSFSVGSDPSPLSYPKKDMHHVSSLQGTVNMTSQEMPKIGPLTEYAWKIVIGMLADPRGLLSEAQKRAIFAYGKDRHTLAQEAEILGKTESVQMWRVLDAIGCLSYNEKL